VRHALRPCPAFALFTLLVALPSAVEAADTLEAFEPGVSDFEAGFATDGAGGAVSAVVGAGLTRQLSVSTAIEQDLAAADPTAFGVGAFLGLHDRWVGVDLFGEFGWDGTQGAPDGWMAGLELDDPRRLVMPYLRTAVAGSFSGMVEEGIVELGVTTVEPLGRVQPHLELAMALDWQGYAGLDVAVGPNLALGDSVELIPELRTSWSMESPDPAVSATVGVIVTRAPESWDARIARRQAERERLALNDLE
jgi:hypothetical protein